MKRGVVNDECGNPGDDASATTYHGDDARPGSRAAATRLGEWLAEEVAAEGLSSDKAFDIVSSLAAAGGGTTAEKIAADAVTLLFAVCLDYEDYRRDVEDAVEEIRALAYGEGYLPSPTRRAAWVETRPYAEMRAAVEKALSNTAEKKRPRGA